MRNVQQYFDRLKKAHPRSSSVGDFQDIVKDLLNDPEKTVKRSVFRLPMGDQWGLSFVDGLVEEGILHLEKIGRDQVLRGKTIADEDSEALDSFEAELNRIKKVYMNLLDFSISFDREDFEVRMTCKENVTTKHHWEKGHYSDDVLEEEYESVVNLIKTDDMVQDICKLYKKYFGDYDFTLNSKKLGKERVFHREGHMGILYEFTVIIH